MKLVQLQLPGDNETQVNPQHVAQIQPVIAGDQTLLWLRGDNMPTTIDEPFVEVAAQLNEAMEDETATAIHNGDCEHIENAKALVTEIRRLQYAFLGAAIAFIILLLIIIGRAH